MSSSQTTASSVPTGRLELLRWINAQSQQYYPTIESLRDGVAYSSLVASTIEKHGTHQPSAKPSGGLSTKPSSFLARLDTDVTYLVTVGAAGTSVQPQAPDPSQDSMQTRSRCEKNFLVLQDLLHQCVPPSMSLRLDTKRLAAGKLQEHLRLLQWCCQFVHRISTAAAASARKSNEANPAGDSDRQRGTTRAASASSGVRKHRDAPPSFPSAGGVARSGSAVSPDERGRRTPYEASRYQSSLESLPASSSHQLPVETTTVSESNTLVSLLRDVEAYEAAVWRLSAGVDDVASAGVVQQTRVTFETVRSLLQERDVLWQTLTAIECEVQAAPHAGSFVEQMQSIFSSGSSR